MRGVWEARGETAGDFDPNTGGDMPEFLMNVDWPQVVAVGLVLIASLAGVALTVATLPGTWLTLGVGVIVKVWRPELLPWWVLGVALGIAILAEVVEFFASSMGAAKAGASRRGAWGALIGSLVGAIAGSAVPPFPLGTILGGVVGAGAGTFIAERHGSATWKQAGKAAGGAAVGRLAATAAKTALACVISLMLSIAAVVGAVWGSGGNGVDGGGGG